MSDIIKNISGTDLILSIGDNAPTRQVFGKYLYEGELGVLFGDTNTGKSILANDIAFFVGGKGHDWPNMESPQIPTMYIDMEMSTQQFANRYRSALNYIPDIYTRTEVDILNADEKTMFPAIRDNIVSQQSKPDAPKFIIIDNITDGFGSIFSPTQMRDLIREFKNLKDEYGLTIYWLLIALNVRQILR